MLINYHKQLKSNANMKKIIVIAVMSIAFAMVGIEQNVIDINPFDKDETAQ